MKKTLLLFVFAGLFLNLSAVKKVAYITLTKTMDEFATPQNNDPVIQVLKADANLEVTVKVISTTDVITDLAEYDVIIVQESLGGGDAILKPTGSLALATLPKPSIYNKSYAFKQGRALTTSTATGGKESNLSMSITVDASALSNDLFKACTIGSSNEIILFNALTTDAGATGIATSIKGVNYSTGNVVSGTSTILAGPTILSTDAAPVAISFNDIPAGSTIDSETTISRIITVGMNYGAICATGGTNITDDGLTVWRNAVYMLAGLPVPSTKAQLPTAVPVTYETHAKVIAVDYYTVNGARVTKPSKGIYIKRITFENGTQKLNKVVLTEAVAR